MGVALVGKQTQARFADLNIRQMGTTTTAASAACTEAAPYTVVLTSQPSDAVTVATACEGGQCSTAPAQLTFTAANWQSAQTVLVTAAHDDVYEGRTPPNVRKLNHDGRH